MKYFTFVIRTRLVLYQPHAFLRSANLSIFLWAYCEMGTQFMGIPYTMNALNLLFVVYLVVFIIISHINHIFYRISHLIELGRLFFGCFSLRIKCVCSYIGIFVKKRICIWCGAFSVHEISYKRMNWTNITSIILWLKLQRRNLIHLDYFWYFHTFC